MTIRNGQPQPGTPPLIADLQQRMRDWQTEHELEPSFAVGVALAIAVDFAHDLGMSLTELLRLVRTGYEMHEHGGT